MIRIYSSVKAKNAVCEKLYDGDLVIDTTGGLYTVSFVDRRKVGTLFSYVITARAEYDHDNGGWYRTHPGTRIELFATAETTEEAIPFALMVEEHYENKREEIERLERQYLTAVRLLADEFIA